jgi:catechol 2,3-dioxygenase
MTTDPLDVEDLVRTAGGAEWDGAPGGTIVGHVHLHVGALEDAERFYHRGLGLDKTVWTYPGALFFAAGGYHHHLGTNVWSSAPPAAEDEARLLAWELLVPTAADVARAAGSLELAGHAAETADGGLEVADPWGTTVRIVALS